MPEFTPRQLRLIEEHRDINAEINVWSDDVIEDWEQRLADKGWQLPVSPIQWSGFWCQGDGASFTGNIGGDIHIAHWIAAWGFAEDYPAIAMFVRWGVTTELWIKISRKESSGRYVHENTVSADVEDDSHISSGDLHEVREAVIEAWRGRYEDEVMSLRDAVFEAAQDDMRAIYRDLRAEHEYQTSDEEVWETLKCNDMAGGEQDDDDVEDHEPECERQHDDAADCDCSRIEHYSRQLLCAAA